MAGLAGVKLGDLKKKNRDLQYYLIIILYY